MGLSLSATAAEEKMKVHAKEKKKAPQMDWMKKYELFSNFWDIPLQGHFKDQRTDLCAAFCMDESVLWENIPLTTKFMFFLRERTKKTQYNRINGDKG